MKRPLPIWPLGQMRFAIGLNVLRTPRCCRDFFLSRGEDVAPGHSINFTFLGFWVLAFESIKQWKVCSAHLEGVDSVRV